MALIQRTSNPALNDKIIRGLGATETLSSQEHMTISGAVNKSFILLALAIASASWTWSQTLATGTVKPDLYMGRCPWADSS